MPANPAEVTPITRKHYASLVGKKIKAIEYETDAYGDPDPWPVLVFTDGTKARVSRDPEGNGPGFLDIIDPPIHCDECKRQLNDGEKYAISTTTKRKACEACYTKATKLTFAQAKGGAK